MIAGSRSPVALAQLLEAGTNRRRGSTGLEPLRRTAAAAAAPAASVSAVPKTLQPFAPASAAASATTTASATAPAGPEPGAPGLAAAAGADPGSARSPLPPARSGSASLTGLDPLSRATATALAEAGPATTCGCSLCQQTFRSLTAEPRAEAAARPVLLASGLALASSLDLSASFRLHSNPGASKTLYLDFDGHITSGTYWNTTYGKPTISTPKFDFDGNVDVFSNAELERIQFIWQRVAEDFAPFNINVTTEDPGSAALIKADVAGDNSWGARAVIGGGSLDWFGSAAGGVSFVNVMGNPLASPSFIFANDLANGDEKYTAEAISHELSHALGLSHDGTGTTAYYAGQGSGATSWGAIMGVAYSQAVSQWSKGEYNDANNREDDLAIIASTTNGAGYRPDDFGNRSSSATALIGPKFNQFGIIETNTDSDWFSFSTGSGDVSLSITNACQAWVSQANGTFSASLLAGRSPNLDIEASLYDAAGRLISSSNPADSLSASINLALSAGTYYLKVDGVGFADPRSNGYSNYASLGQYLISGKLAATGRLVLTAPTSLSISEAGGSAAFSVRLSEAPSADVLIALAVSDSSEGQLSTSQLRFNPLNWSTDQQVILSGRDDLLVDGNQPCTITLTTSSTDSAYQGLAATVLTATNADNDVAVPVWFGASQGNLVNSLTFVQSPAVVGKVSSSASSDDMRLAISEGLIKSASGSHTSALDGYQWRFDNLINVSQLLVEGYLSASGDNEGFLFQVSTNGSTWTNALTLSNSTETITSATLSAPINGTAWVKVVDTNRSLASSSIDTLYVDRIALLGSQSDLRPELTLTTSSAQAVEDRGSEAVFTLRRGGDSSQALDVAFSLAGSATADDYSVLDGAGSTLNGSVRLAAGQSSASIRIRPQADGRSEGSETVLLTLQPLPAALSDQWRLGGASSERVVIVDTLIGSSTSRVAPYATASLESGVFGRVSGGFSATGSADGLVETIQEVLAGSDANATSQLEHRWTFSNLTSANRFALKASASAGDDQFRFEYLANGTSSWKAIQTVDGGFSGTVVANLSTSLSGSVQVRVIDLNRNAGAGLIDSIAIDAMAFLPSSAPLPF